MIVVEKEGNIEFQRVKCDSCGSILKYLFSDEKSTFNPDGYFGMEATYYIKCPVCGEKVVTRAMYGEDYYDWRMKDFE